TLFRSGDANGDGISGRINGVTDPETGSQAIGRFGWKASQPSVRVQTGLALREDMGLGNPVYPADGLDLTPEEFNDLTLYARALGVPLRRNFDDPDVLAGEQLFAAMNCAACHKPEVTTGNGHALTELRNQTIRPYTDLLLHDMGPGLADQVREGSATGSEWRTPPLWGIGRTEEVSGHTRFLHDGRAHSLEEAILWHGGEAEASRDAYKALSVSERAQVIDFLRSL
ncbi:MAG: di-heme oxidoredictase family protein, partial [Puniceicoccales bacterium]